MHGSTILGIHMGDKIFNSESLMNLVLDTVFTNEYCMDTASTDSHGGTVFPGKVRYSLVVRYSLGYRIHSDTGPFEGQIWLIIADACSKWPEIIAMSSTTAEKTVDILRSVFSRYGIPDQIVTANSSRFTAEEFKQFFIGNGIEHTITAPYNPSTNGEAKRFVQMFKTLMQKHKGAL